MPVTLSSYDTTFGRRYLPAEASSAIVKAVVSNNLTNSDSSYTPIKDTTDMPVDIPSFMHPLFVDQQPVHGLFVDVRPYVSKNRLSGEMKITSTADYNLALARAGLEQIWRNEPSSVLRSVGPLPASVYASWLAESISKKFGIGPEDQYKLTIFSAWMYFSLFADEVTPNDADYLRVAKSISTATRIPVEVVMEILDGQDYIKDIADYCGRLEEIVDVRLRGFTPVLLMPLLAATWYGANSQQIIAIAIEHVPTFIAVVLAASSERAYHRAKLADIMDHCPAKGTKRDFEMHMTALLKSQ